MISSLVLALFLLTSCGEKECKVNNDCSQRTCNKVSCVENICEYDPIPNCCGNDIKDKIEDGQPGNECTCPGDYGVCEGEVEVGIPGSSRTKPAEFLEKYCTDRNKCVLGVPPEKVRPVTLQDERDFSFFKLGISPTFNEPFDTAQDQFAITITMLDDHQDLVLPIKLTKIMLKDGQVVFGSLNKELILNGVGDKVTYRVPVTYQLQQYEERKQILYQINYEYTKKVKDKRQDNGSYTYKNELVRDDFDNRFSTRITFVKSGEQ